MDFTLVLGSVVFNIIDIIMIAVALIAGVAGAFEGFAKSFASKAAILVGLVAGLMFSELAGVYIFARFGLPVMITSLLSYIVCFMAGYILTLILGSMLSNIFDGVGLGSINSLLGFIWAVIFAFAVCAVILMLLSYQHLFDVNSLLNNSYIFNNVFAPVIPIAKDFIQNVQ